MVYNKRMTKEASNVETAIQRLEKIVEELSGGDIEVEAGLKKFKEGAELVKFCRNELKTAENEFKKLKTELEEEPAEMKEF